MALHIKILIGLVLGVLWAFISSYVGFKDFTLAWINPWGTIFMNLLKLIAVPLVLFSIIKGVYDLADISKVGKLGLKTIGIFIITTLSAVSIGMLLGNAIQPGKYIDSSQATMNRIQYEIWAESEGKKVLDGKSFLNDRSLKATVKQAKELLGVTNGEVNDKILKATSNADKGPLNFLVNMVPSNVFWSFSNGKILQVIFFAILFGLTMLYLDYHLVKPVADLINGLNGVFLKMIDLIMEGAPYFVFCLMAGKLTELAGNDLNSMFEVFKSLGLYSLTVILGLSLMIFGIYPLLLKIFTKGKSLKEFYTHASPAQMLAFSTSSSAATLPVTMDCVHDNMKVSKDVSSFVLPIGATINMDGTSLYQAIAALFLAQFHLIDLSIAQQLTIIFTALLASIGSAAVPSAGLVMLILVLESVGLNPAWIAIVLPVDRILDMCRTVVNVTGDMTVCNVVDYQTQKDQNKL